MIGGAVCNIAKTDLHVLSTKYFDKTICYGLDLILFEHAGIETMNEGTCIQGKETSTLHHDKV